MTPEHTHNLVVTDRDLYYLRGHLAFKEGTGRDLYDHVSAMIRDLERRNLGRVVDERG